MGLIPRLHINAHTPSNHQISRANTPGAKAALNRAYRRQGLWWGCEAQPLILPLFAFIFFQLCSTSKFDFIAFISRCVENIEEHWDNVRRSIPRTRSKFSNTLVKWCKHSPSWGKNIKKEKNIGIWGILRTLTCLCSGQRTSTLYGLTCLSMECRSPWSAGLAVSPPHK